MGFVRPVGSAVLFSIIFALLISVVKHKSKMSSDTIIGVFSSMSIALGIFLATLGGKSFAKQTLILLRYSEHFPEEIGFLAIVLVLIIIFWLFFFNHLLVVSINAS